MKASNNKTRNSEFVVRYFAVCLAYQDGAAFTVYSLAAKLGSSPNRHLRHVLNDMVVEGKLAKHKRLYGDGHYRMVYSAKPEPHRVGV